MAEKIILPIPFYPNTSDDPNRCAQVSMLSVLKYATGKDFEIEELDRATGRRIGLGTSTPQIAVALYELGLEVTYYSKTDASPWLEGEAGVRKAYGDAAEFTLKMADIPKIVEAVRKMGEYGIFELRQIGMDEIEEQLRKGRAIVALIDWNTIKGRNAYQGHFVVVTGFDDASVYLHQSGPADPSQNMAIEKSLFLNAWNANGTDNDLIVVHGKR
ncbi:MAG: peptidase C39 family protein [Candidatus Micrarchaeota archaeon]|nr:peptidase C39 family protein [Candidatus Micrarchaeota archaeon]